MTRPRALFFRDWEVGMRKSSVTIIIVSLLAAASVHASRAEGGGGAAGAGAGSGSAAARTGAGQSVGGGPPAGQIGGGPPAPNNASGANAAPKRVSPDHPAAGLDNAPTVGGVIGGTTGVPPKGSELGGTAPSNSGQSGASNVTSAQDASAAATKSGEAQPEIVDRPVKPRPCSVSARETDGTTTCIGVQQPR
ncbi:hypothetical protein ACVIJ6_006611 [Bradyrhizobium sp. USDA 4369]